MTAPEAHGLGPIEVERNDRLRFLRHPDDSVARGLDARLDAIPDGDDRVFLWEVRRYAEALDYQHPGQSKDVYLAHPFRVAAMYLDLAAEPEPLGAAIALVHNTLEVSTAGKDGLERDLGSEIADAVMLLTVDRSRQWNWSYKDEYYTRIDSAGPQLRLVKVVDKLDNLFVLHLNPSDETRDRYLHEIVTWVIPLARRVTHGLADYLERLVVENRRIGHRPLDVSDLTPREEDTKRG